MKVQVQVTGWGCAVRDGVETRGLHVPTVTWTPDSLRMSRVGFVTKPAPSISTLLWEVGHGLADCPASFFSKQRHNDAAAASSHQHHRKDDEWVSE